MTTPNLELPEFGAAGVPSGTDLTLGMRRLDAIVQLAVIAIQAVPPADPALGDRYIIATGASGAWAGRVHHLAFWNQGVWAFFVPRQGWTAIIDGEIWIFDETIPDWLLLGPFTPGIPALDEVTDPDLSDLMLVAYDTGTAEYVRVAADAVGGSVASSGINLAMFHPGVPTTSKLMFQFTVPDNWSVPGNLLGSVGHIGTNPTASFTMNVAVNGSNVGTIVVSTVGVFTFTTTSGNPVALVAGDKITITAPASTDATAADISATLLVFSEIVGSGNPNRISHGFFFPGTPIANQLIAKTVIARSIIFPANFSTSYGDVGTNPTATFTITVALQGAVIGTITISTGGVFTFATTGGVQIIADAGDVLELEAQTPADATVANISATLVGEI